MSWLLPCSDTLIPATTRNKRLIYQALDHIVPLGKASLASALNFTYRFILEVMIVFYFIASEKWHVYIYLLFSWTS